MKKCVYLVVDEGERVREILASQGYELIVGNGTLDDDALARCDAIIPGKAYITDEVLQKAPKVQIISKFGVGVDRIDVDACSTRGVYVANTPTSNYVSVAEHTAALLLAAAKQLYPISKRLHEKGSGWVNAKLFQGMELSGKTLSIIGFGNIGRRVAKLMSCFEMEIIAYDPFTVESSVPDHVQLTRSLEYALSKGDFVSLHVAGSSDTRHLIGANELAAMKSNAILINTTRGFVVNEADLIDALQKGIIAGAALDVFSEEPTAEDNPLLYMDNVIATPHNAANTPEARMRAQIACAENIIECFEGKQPTWALNSPAL